MLKVSSKFKKRTEAFQGEHAETTLFSLAREFLFVSSASRVLASAPYTHKDTEFGLGALV